MKALFLAGGRGVRLQPLTNHLPKPMVPIMNIPLIERAMINLKTNGISQIVISTCYQPEYIKNYFGNGDKLGLKINYVVEDIPLGTGGAIKKAGSLFNEPFVVFNSDILTDINIKEMIDLHMGSRAIATIAATEVEDNSAYGVIEHDENGTVVSFLEKPAPGRTSSKSINAGIYIFQQEILNEIPVDSVVSVERQIFPKLLAKRYKISVYNSNCYWMDIGTIEKYMQAHADIMNGKCNLVNCKFTDNQIHIGKNVHIHPTSKIVGPAFIGDHVAIAKNTHICNSVIGNNVSIGAGSRITGSIVWDGNHIDEEENIFNKVVTTNPKVLKKPACVAFPESQSAYNSQPGLF